MADHTDTLAKPTLEYPFETVPARSNTLEIAPGVHWIRMPLPFKLDHINLWALEDGERWAVVDTGVRSDETAAVWEKLFSGVLGGRPVRRVFVTHMHPDHVGMAGWFARRPGTEIWMTRLEYLTCRTTVADTGREAPAAALEFYRNAAWSDTAIERYRARFGAFGTLIHALPDSYRRLSDGQELSIGGRTWRVVVGSGHSPEHACLHCPDLGLFISGDQVLPRISSNVSVYPMEPFADPMSDWYRSLGKIRKEVGDDVLVLPSHNECFRGLHARLDYLVASQDHVFERLQQTLRERKRVVDVFPALFGRAIAEADATQFGLATGEAIACLNHLVHKELVSRSIDDDGVAWYQAKATRSPH